MFKVVSSETNFSQDELLVKRVEKNYLNIYTLASSYSYSKEDNYGSAQLGNTVVSLF